MPTLLCAGGTEISHWHRSQEISTADRADPAWTKLGQPGGYPSFQGFPAQTGRIREHWLGSQHWSAHCSLWDRLTSPVLPAFPSLAAPKLLSSGLCHQHQMLQFSPQPRIYYISLAFAVGYLIYHSILICWCLFSSALCYSPAEQPPVGTCRIMAYSQS